MRHTQLEFSSRDIPKPPGAVLRRYRQEVISFFDNTPHARWIEYHPPGSLPDPWELVELHRVVVQRDPEYAGNYLHLADAYAGVGSIELAIRLAGLVHQSIPECMETTELILDLLFFQGKTENDYAWIQAPKVHHLDERTKELILRYLQGNGPVDAFDLQFDLFDHEYLHFDEQELGEYLARDERFEVDQPDAWTVMLAPAGWGDG